MMDYTYHSHTIAEVPVPHGKQIKSMPTNQKEKSTSLSNAGLSNGGLILPSGSTIDTTSSISNVGRRMNRNKDIHSSGSINECVVSRPKVNRGNTTFKIVPKRAIEGNPTYTVQKKFRLDPGVTIYANGSCQGGPPPDKPVSWDDYMRYLDTSK